LDGALAHQDSMGNRSTIVPGEVQRMSAGTGVTHSEFNGQADRPVHFLQIWLLPDRRGLAPGYEQRAIPPQEERGALRLVASRDGRGDSVTIHQDADLYASRLEPGERGKHTLGEGALEVVAAEPAPSPLSALACFPPLSPPGRGQGEGSGLRLPELLLHEL